MKKQKGISGGGFYIALCCCVMVIALIGYAGSYANRHKENPSKQASDSVIIEETSIPTIKPTIMPIKTAEPKAVQKDAQTPIPTSKPTKTAAPKVKSVAAPVEEEETKAAAKKVSFESPLLGNVVAEFSGEKLIYNTALADWRTHSGVDISAAANADIKAAAEGVVLEVFSSALGESIVIDHKNGYTTLYAGLVNTDMVSVGKEIKSGDIIGQLNEKSTGENITQTHLHFEILKDGDSVDPTEFISFK